MVVVIGVGGADVLLRDGSGGVGGRYAYGRYKQLQKTSNIRLTLGVRDIDAFDPFAPGKIANRFNPWLKLDGGTFSLSVK